MWGGPAPCCREKQAQRRGRRSGASRLRREAGGDRGGASARCNTAARCVCCVCRLALPSNAQGCVPPQPPPPPPPGHAPRVPCLVGHRHHDHWQRPHPHQEGYCSAQRSCGREGMAEGNLGGGGGGEGGGGGRARARGGGGAALRQPSYALPPLPPPRPPSLHRHLTCILHPTRFLHRSMHPTCTESCPSLTISGRCPSSQRKGGPAADTGARTGRRADSRNGAFSHIDIPAIHPHPAALAWQVPIAPALDGMQSIDHKRHLYTCAGAHGQRAADTSRWRRRYQVVGVVGALLTATSPHSTYQQRRRLTRAAQSA